MYWTDNTPVDYPPGNPYKLGGGNMFPWSSNEPNNDAHMELCTLMVTNSPDTTVLKQWYDYNCNNMLAGYVCEKFASFVI
uniref:C-type lectin domain-containing protein n=1 Tax=Panagrolaimus sp. JU765 TaxID=591449 RepID=A0AC34R9D4_9BILA